MGFNLIDEIESVDDDQVVAVKRVTDDASYLRDHFPSYPILPGVLMLETLVQAAVHWVSTRPELTGLAKTWTLGEVRNVKYGQMVQPGQCLRVAVHYDDRKSRPTSDGPPALAFRGQGEVEGGTAVAGRFTLVPAASQPSK